MPSTQAALAAGPTPTDQIDQLVNQTLTTRVSSTSLASITATLGTLESLVELSYQRYTYAVDDDSEDSHGKEMTVVTPDDMQRLQKAAVPWLVKVVIGEWARGQDDEDSSKQEEVIEWAANLMAHMSGRSACGSITRTWYFPPPPGTLENTKVAVRIHEPGFVGDDIGFKTWGAAPMLAKKISQTSLIPNLTTHRLLELGTGTGLVGLVCAKLGARSITLTDYHPNVLATVARNVQENALSTSQVTVAKLDWREIDSSALSPDSYDVLIGSDLLYEVEHARLLPRVVERFLVRGADRTSGAGAFHFMVPLRRTHWEEVEVFEEEMQRGGFVSMCTEESEREEEEGGGVMRYRYWEWRRGCEVEMRVL